MCGGSKPKAQPLPPPRALARAPQRIVPSQRPTTGAYASRSTVVNPNGVVNAAPTAQLGGSGVVLGG